MRKRIKIIIITAIISMYATGCSIKTDMMPDMSINSSNKISLDETTLSSEYVFQATVIENEAGIIVEPVADSSELNSSDRIYVESKDGNLFDEEGHEITPSDIEVGDLVEITYDGAIRESYPARISSSNLSIVKKAAKTDGENNSAIEDEFDTLLGVNMNIAEVTNTNIKVEIINTTDKDMIFGEDYKLQQFIDGKWIDSNYIIDNWGFNAIAYMLTKDVPASWEHNWEWLYGTLSSGTYRMLKTVLVSNETGASDSYIITADFNIK